MRTWTGALLAGVSVGALAAPVVDRQSATPVTNVSREQLENLPTGRRLEDLIRICPSSTIPTVTTQPQILIDGRPVTPGNAIDCLKPDDIRMIEVYKLHNQARYEVGSRPLVWDPVLAAQARAYGPELAQYGRPVHSSRVGRETSRENLLQALPGTSPNAMMGVWIGEKQNFVNGIFPDVSRTGNWADVGHYTQLVWPTTTNLGCAIHTGGQFDWLICRYSPPGNKDGKMVLAEREQPAPLPTTKGGLIHPGGIPAPRAAPYDPCSPTALVAADARIPWNRDKPKPTAAPTPPPESILDDIGGDPEPPPESILNDVDEGTSPPPDLQHSTGQGIEVVDSEESSTPPPESILDDVGQDSTCKPAPTAPTGIVGQPKLQDLSWLPVPDRLDEWVFQIDWGFKAAEKKCDAAAIAALAAHLDELEEQTNGSAKLINPARAAGEFSTVNADDLTRSVDHTRKFIGESRAKLEQLRQRCAGAR